jgi:mono/diheme cytochrome c family protein
MGALAALCVGLAIAGQAQAASAENGARLAERWCSSCHVVGADAKAGTSSDAPPFPQLAADGGWSADQLRTFLTKPHAPMPPLELSRPDIEDLVSYITSLRP